MSKIAIGINKEIKDNYTGVTAQFHSVVGMTADYLGNVQSVKVGHFFNKQLFDEGYGPLSSTDFTLTGKIERGADFVDWALKALVQPVDGQQDAFGLPLEPHMFTGAELVNK